MPPLPSLSGKAVVKALERAGYTVASVNGSHYKMRRSGSAPLSVPVHGARDMVKGTLRGIIRQTGMSEAEFLQLL